MPTLLICKGLPASGKTTFAKTLTTTGWMRVSKDDIREELSKTGWTWSRQNERDVKNKEENLISSYLMSGKNVVVDSTNFGKHENRLRSLAKQAGAEFEIKDFTDVPVEVCIERNSKREKPVPEKVIWEMYNKHIRKDVDNSNKSPVKWVKGLPTAVICDLDGTLAIHVDRGPYDVEKCHTDALNPNIDSVLEALQQAGHQIIFMSGREDKVREKTRQWLIKMGWGYGDFLPYPLFMRATNDRRNDTIIKNELFDAHVRDKYNVVCVLDDRDRVVMMWRDLGLTCLQVAYGNF